MRPTGSNNMRKTAVKLLQHFKPTYTSEHLSQHVSWFIYWFYAALCDDRFIKIDETKHLKKTFKD